LEIFKLTIVNLKEEFIQSSSEN